MCIYSSRLNIVFLTGFGVGITFALLFALLEAPIDRNVVCDIGTPGLLRSNHRHSVRNINSLTSNKEKSNEMITFENWIEENLSKKQKKLTYETWLKRYNVQVSDIDMDFYVYGPTVDAKSESTKLLESDWLRSKIHITCVVFVEKLKLAESIKGTWGPRCNQLYFFGHHLSNSEIPVISFTTKLTSSWHLLCEAINYVWNVTMFNKTKNSENMQWIIFVKDDTMVIPENLRYIVAPLDFNEGHYLGHSVILWGQAYNVAQAGYVLSRGAVEKIIEMFDTQQKCASGGRYWKKEDYYLGKHLASVGIHPSDTRDTYLRDTFHGYSLQILLWGIAKPGSYWTRALYPPGPDCCSTRSVTFSVGEPDKMYTLNYILYHLNVYITGGIYGNKPAPTPMPDEKVWESVLKEEFNITALNEISSERYYEIWRERYSDPEQFIMKNYKNMPDVLSSLLTAYASEKKLSDNSSTG